MGIAICHTFITINDKLKFVSRKLHKMNKSKDRHYLCMHVYLYTSYKSHHKTSVGSILNKTQSYKVYIV